jgi:plastocyanin
MTRRVRWGRLGLCTAVGLAPGANAAELAIKVTDARGAPAPDAVVALVAPGVDAAPVRASAPKVIDQKDETFIPYVEVFRPGDQVVFRNSDTTRHHVYSFSPTRSFEFVLRPSESSAPLTLEKTGVVAVGCNIHDRMITYLFVSDARYVARTGRDGLARFTDIPEGAYAVQAWHPQLPPGKAAAEQRVVLGNERKEIGFSFALLPDPRGPADREKSRY